MDGVDKGLFPSKSTASPKSTGFGENNENDSSQDKMIPQFQNNRKTVAKHFMSPTISAASKAASPRKKILGERKENLGICDAKDHKKFSLNWNSPQNSNSSYRNVSSHDLVSESEDDSSAKAYDPSKKRFLSPRPKYLHFNPNRRLEIVQRLEREVRDELISSSESQEVNDEQESSPDEIEDSCFSPPKECVMEAESVDKTEEDDVSTNHESDEEEEEEEEEEEKGWCFKGLLKVVLMLIACLLSTSYICSMNSPTPSPTQEAIWNLRDGYLMIQRQTLEFVNMKMHNVGSFEMEVGDDYSEVEDAVIDEDGGIEENVDSEIGVDAVENLENDDIAKDEATIYVDSLQEEDNLNKIEALKSDILGGGGVESETHNTVLLMDAESDEVRAGIENVGAEVDVDAVENLANDGDKDETTIYVDTLKEEDNLIKIEASKLEIVGGGGVESETRNSVQLQEIIGGGVISMKSTSEETPKESQIVGDTDSLFHEKFTDSLTEVDEMEGSSLLKSVPEETPKLEELDPSHEKLTDEIGNGGNEAEMKKVGWNTSGYVIGVIAALFSTLFAAVYHSKKTSIPPAKESKSILKPHKFPVQEKAVDKKVEFLARPSSPPWSTEEARKEVSHHLYAPSVELLGEIEVGSHRSYTKYEPEFEERKATFFTPTQQQSVAASSASYGNFTNEKKEEGGRVVDATPSITPVRRSNRLRNRAASVITSPY